MFTKQNNPVGGLPTGGRDTIHYERNRSFNEGASAVLGEKAILAEEAQEAQEEAAALARASFKGNLGGSRASETRRAVQEAVERRATLMEETAAFVFANVAYDALPLQGGDFLEKNGKTILENYGMFFREAIRTGLINGRDIKAAGTGHAIDMWRACEAAVAEVDMTGSDDSGHSSTLATSSSSGSSHEAAQAIKDKVVDVVRNERDSALEREQFEQSLTTEQSAFSESLSKVRRPDPHSLFQSIAISVTRAAGEGAMLTTESVLAETIVTYTLLETANTLRLYKMGALGTQKLADSFAAAPISTLTKK
jgi:hypothetical protein